MKNVIDCYKIDITAGNGPFIKQLRDNIAVKTPWYSWSLYKKDDKHYRLTYHVSQTDRFNTLNVNCAIINIVNAAVDSNKAHGIIGYDQPTLSILVEVMTPLVNSLVNREAKRWLQLAHGDLTYDDLMQMCYTCLCELYRKGYYIHKALLKRAFTNALYYKLRKSPRDTVIVSLTAPVHDTDDLVTVQDTIPDIDEEYEREECENNEVESQILSEQREIIVNLIGERRYNDLIRAWRSKTVDNQSSATVNRLRKKLMDAGYSPDQWNKYFE